MKFTVRTAETRYDPSVSNAGGVALSNRAARSGTTIHGWPAVFVGSVVAAAGTALAAVVMEFVAPGAVKESGMPRWILGLVSLLFAFAGASAAAHGIRDVGRRARIRQLRAAHADEPWQWDHPWNERVAQDDTAGRARHFFVAAMFLFLFLTPAHWIGFFGPRLARSEERRVGKEWRSRWWAHQ